MILLHLQDFLTEQGMLETARMLEKESLVARNSLGHDLTALRSLVLDGQWAEVEDVLRPLHNQTEVDTSGMLMEIRRQRFLELFEGTVRPLGLASTNCQRNHVNWFLPSRCSQAMVVNWRL